ncbi:MAG: alpha/beta hydrolase [Lachnospiraceae bacterium]|nr:alpha/beta hydrolase [Lachnospiraceae bacterium]
MISGIKKLAIVFPGIGYHKDKPLLYYAGKMVKSMGFDILSIEYRNMPKKIIGDAKMIDKAIKIGYDEAKEQLEGIDFSVYEDIVFVGKSIGTAILAQYASEHMISSKQLWYTPIEATFLFPSKNAIAFIGDDDPWSDVDKIKRMAGEYGIGLYSYPGCNHSLECRDVDKDLVNIRDVMKKSLSFLERDP